VEGAGCSFRVADLTLMGERMGEPENGLIQIARREAVLIPVIVVGLLAFVFKVELVAQGAIAALVVAILLIVAVVAISVRIAHHSETLAAKVGDPYGTMILTLSVVRVFETNDGLI
jgi:Ca2+:H+ antiporter